VSLVEGGERVWVVELFKSCSDRGSNTLEDLRVVLRVCRKINWANARWPLIVAMHKAVLWLAVLW
jgi:hypothetical protein